METLSVLKSRDLLENLTTSFDTAAFMVNIAAR